MDSTILKAILCSCESVAKDLAKSEDYQQLAQEQKFLPTSNNIFNALSLSLTNLLSYKVSREAYQRYTVRLHVINVLRDWCRVTEAFKDLRVFTDERQTLTFVGNLLEKYLTNDVLDRCESSNDLLPLTSALMCLAPTNSRYKCHVERLLSKLSQLESCEDAERILCYAVRKDANLKLELSTVEDIYESQRYKLIEQPLLDHFALLCTDLNKDSDVDEPESLNLLDQLFEVVSKSPRIFLLACGFLKELFIQLDHSAAVVDFVQSSLKRIKECCKNRGRDILDLYPRSLQSIVILLQIDPMYHTVDSKSATLRTLRSIHSEGNGTAVTLLLHFPQWLKLFAELLLPNSNTIP